MHLSVFDKIQLCDVSGISGSNISVIMIIFMYTLLYPVTTSAVFYNLPPMFTSRPLRPEELAQMIPHTTPKPRTIPFAPHPTTKMVQRYHEEFSGGLFPSSPPLYTSRPLRLEELLQMAPHTTPKTRTTPFAILGENYQKQIKTKLTGAIFHTSPPLYTSIPLRPEELIQMAPHKNPNTWTTPFERFTTTERTVGTYREESSTGFSKAILGQPYEESDELYSPTLWSFGTFMNRNYTSATEHPASHAYASDYVNKFNLLESGTYPEADYTSGKNLTASKSPDSNLQKGFIDDVARSESYATKTSVPEISTSEPERESLNKLSEGLANQSSPSKPGSSFIKDSTSARNSATIRTTTPVEFTSSDSSSSEYQREFMDHVNLVESGTFIDDHTLGGNVPESFALQKDILQSSSIQRGNTSGEYYASGTKTPILTTSTPKNQTEFSGQTNPVEYVTYAEEGNTLGRKQDVPESATFRSQKEPSSQFSSNSKHFNGEDYATKLLIPETSTLAYQTKPTTQVRRTESGAYVNLYHTLVTKQPPPKYQTSSEPNNFFDKEHTEALEQPVITKPDLHFNSHTPGTKQPILKSTSMAYQRTTKIPFVETHTSKHKNKILKQYNTTESNTCVTFAANSSVSQTSTSNPSKDPVNKINPSKYVSFNEKQYTPAINSPIAQTSASDGLNDLVYMQLKNEANIPNEEILEPVTYDNYNLDHFRVTDAPTKLYTAQITQPQLEDTGHIMPVYNQPADNKVAPIPRLVSRIQQHSLNQGEYRITSTDLPYYYESTDSNTGSALWHALQSESYTVPQQNVPKHPISNAGMTWSVPQTSYNVPAPAYTWRLSGANEKLSNFDTLAGKFEVSSARNEIKLIYRPNMPEVAPKSGSTHYETVENADGGKTHKLVLYVR